MSRPSARALPMPHVPLTDGPGRAAAAASITGSDHLIDGGPVPIAPWNGHRPEDQPPRGAGDPVALRWASRERVISRGGELGAPATNASFANSSGRTEKTHRAWRARKLSRPCLESVDEYG